MRPLYCFIFLFLSHGVLAEERPISVFSDTFNISEITSVKVESNDSKKLGHPMTLKVRGKYFTNQPNKAPNVDMENVFYHTSKEMRIRRFKMTLRKASKRNKVAVGAIGDLLLPEAEFSLPLEFAVYEWARERKFDVMILQFIVGEQLQNITATYDIENQKWSISQSLVEGEIKP